MSAARCVVWSCAASLALAAAGCFDWTVAPVGCETLAEDLAAARTQAVSCAMGATSACASRVDDPCAGSVWLGDSDSAAAAQYQSVLAQFQAASCLCPALASASVQGPGSCVADADGESASCSK